ncbi:trimeric LpxA-like protein [Biscogniauxia marginata]|nr:trimeric LpxA-like protein [Biscogniauxia marginata]
MENFQNTQKSVVKELVGGIGARTILEPPFLPDYGCNIIIGKDSFLNFNLTILDVSLVSIGDRIIFGPNVSIYSASHDTSVLSRMKFVGYGLPVTIEGDCWIGGGTLIMPGVTIG